jgi:hypothetical protein
MARVMVDQGRIVTGVANLSHTHGDSCVQLRIVFFVSFGPCMWWFWVVSGFEVGSSTVTPIPGAVRKLPPRM